MKQGQRKPIPKAMRLKVYEKYNGHCAYCGKESTISKMNYSESA